MKSYIQIRKYIILIMNKILITNSQQPHSDETTYALSYSTANKMLPILRSDHFIRIQLDNPHTIDIKNLKFLVQLTRLLKTDGEVVINGEESQQISTLLKTLHLFQTETSNTSTVFLKTQPQVKEQEKTQKLAIGFQSNEVEEQIDETELLQGQNLEIKKPKVENCDIKPKACANCNCGRKDKEQAPVSKQELVKSINEGKQVSGCGKCFLGDSFRCGTCPYKGLPAFKIGDKLKLVEQGGVIVEQSSTFVSASGKIKLQI